MFEYNMNSAEREDLGTYLPVIFLAPCMYTADQRCIKNRSYYSHRMNRVDDLPQPNPTFILYSLQNFYHELYEMCSWAHVS